MRTVVLDATKDRKTRQDLINELSLGEDDDAKGKGTRFVSLACLPCCLSLCLGRIGWTRLCTQCLVIGLVCS